MVVLATGLQPPESAHQIARMLDIQLSEYGFCKTDKFTPLQTTRPGVFVCGAFSSPKEIVETIIDASGAAAEVMRLLNDRLNTFPFTREWPFLSAEELPPERDVSNDPIRIGIFVCSCGGTISGDDRKKNSLIDIQDISLQAAKWPGVVVSKTMDTACFPESIVEIQEEIIRSNLNRVVIAACSNRTHDPLFQRAARRAGLNPYLVELVNLREQCSRVHQWQSDLANRKALELVRVAVGRVSIAQPVHKQIFSSRPEALVIGGGVSGMTAALAVARQRI